MIHALPRRTSRLRVTSLWIHLLGALAAGFTLLSQEQPSLNAIFSGGGRTNSVAPALYALPAVWPYIAGYLASRRLSFGRAASLALYGAVVLVGTVAGIWFILHPIPAMSLFGTALLVSVFQAVAFATAAAALEARTRDNGAA
jgi:hypothetical protein